MGYIPRLKQEYKDRVVSALTEEFGYKNVMQVPKLQKIVISKGVGAAVSDKKLIDYAIEEITKISGQKAVATISKKDVATIKLRKGMPIGVKVTLRGEKMYEFLDRLTTRSRTQDLPGLRLSVSGTGYLFVEIGPSERSIPRYCAEALHKNATGSSSSSSSSSSS